MVRYSHREAGSLECGQLHHHKPVAWGWRKSFEPGADNWVLRVSFLGKACALRAM